MLFSFHIHSNNRYANVLYLLIFVDIKNIDKFLDCVARSQSQILQDVFVLNTLDYLRGGYYVDFGATDGLTRSNTWQLEKFFSFNGILSEPLKLYFEKLITNRSGICVNKCIYSASNMRLNFFEDVDSRELSGIANDLQNRTLKDALKVGSNYEVSSISLTDLLVENSAPSVIHYLSIDTEGSEYEILKDFDFERFKILIITCEHNYGPNRAFVQDLLKRNNYSLVLQKISQFEDWFILNQSNKKIRYD